MVPDLSPEQMSWLLAGEMLAAPDDDGGTVLLAMVTVKIPPAHVTAHHWHLVPAVSCCACDTLMAADDPDDLSDDLLTSSPQCPPHASDLAGE